MAHVTGFWYRLAGTRNWYPRQVNVSWALANSSLTGHGPCLSLSANDCRRGHYCLYLLAVCFNVLSAAVVLLCVLQIVLIVLFRMWETPSESTKNWWLRSVSRISFVTRVTWVCDVHISALLAHDLAVECGVVWSVCL